MNVLFSIRRWYSSIRARNSVRPATPRPAATISPRLVGPSTCRWRNRCSFL